MKILATVVAMVVLIVAPMGAQNAHSQVEITLGGGVNSPLGDYSDQAKTGWAFTTGIGYRLTPFLALGAEVSFYGNKGSDELSQSLGVGYDVSSSIQQYAAMAKVLLPAGANNVYGKGVFGSYRGIAKVSGPLGDGEAENTDPGYGIGGGFVFNGEGISSFYVELMYHRVNYDGTDVATSFMSYNAGAVFNFNLLN
jgi:hypothetical protein